MIALLSGHRPCGVAALGYIAHDPDVESNALLDSDSPEDTAAMTAAFEEALKRLNVADHEAPIATLVAKKIVRLAKRGERNPTRLTEGVIRASMLHPKRRILAVCGDGGFMMNSQEMETAVRLGLNLVVLILEDSAYWRVQPIRSRICGGGRNRPHSSEYRYARCGRHSSPIPADPAGTP
jgi:Thiamine pyrophosphate enzyme, C-terminal TPP binding domain